MVDSREIPAEIRWKVATQVATAMPVAYGIELRRMLNERDKKEFYDVIRSIWARTGSSQGDLAKELELPAGSAREVAETFILLSSMIFGPELNGGEIRDGEGDSAVVTLSTCPLIMRAHEQSGNIAEVSTGCVAYSKAAVESLNPEYRLWYGKGMCAGDEVCELWIKRRS
jgi:hypothetical protein